MPKVLLQAILYLAEVGYWGDMIAIIDDSLNIATTGVDTSLFTTSAEASSESFAYYCKFANCKIAIEKFEDVFVTELKLAVGERSLKLLLIVAQVVGLNFDFKTNHNY